MNRQVGAGSVKELTEAMIRPFDIGEERSTSRIRARRAAAPADTLGPQTPRYGSSMARVAAATPLDRSHQPWSGCRMVAWDTAKHARCFDPDCRNRRSGGYRAKSPIVPDSWVVQRNAPRNASVAPSTDSAGRLAILRPSRLPAKWQKEPRRIEGADRCWVPINGNVDWPITSYLPGLVGGRRGVEHGFELIQHPVELLLGDDQRRCESNRDVVGLLR
jgi:hypothetical protein